MYKFLFVLFFFSITSSVFTIAAPAVPAAVKPIPVKTGTAIPLRTDTGKVSLRYFDNQKIKTYSSQREFKYEDLTPETDGLWSRFWRWFWNKVGSAAEVIFNNKYSGNVIKYAAFAAVIALVVFIVIKIIGLDLKIFSGRSKAVDLPFSESVENIHEINFKQEIDLAILQHNYRLAVRLCYLFSLKKLNDRNLIYWQPEKTNQTYISELKDETHKKQFSLLTTQFEYIWYGEFFINEERFEKVKSNFDQFNQQVG